MKLTKTLSIFIPAILFVSFFLFIRIIQYQPLEEKIDQTQNQVKDNTIIPIFPEDPILGDKKAARTVILFSDFGCEACEHEYNLLSQIISENPQKVKVIWKGLPVKTYPFNSEESEKYGFCAAKQGKFKEWADIAFKNGENLNSKNLTAMADEIGLKSSDLTTCLEAKATADHIQKTKDLAAVLQIQAVPVVFLDNTQIPAPKFLEDWKEALSK